MSEERLQKILAQAGIASRRAAEKFITDGRVRVNGEVVTELGAKADPDADTIEVDGHGVLTAEPTVYVLMHKPIHVVTTVSDPEKRQTVIDVLGMSRAAGRKSFEGNMPRVFPVGRLDFDAEGLLLLTNDGALANDLLHPRYHVPKTYVVKVSGRPDERQIERLRSGVRLREEDGSTSRKTAPAEVRVIRESPANTWLELVIIEGRHHQVKRMCDAIGHSVIRLIRTEMGGVELGELEPGHWRFLTDAEVELLKAWRGGNAAELRALRGPTTTEKMFGEVRSGGRDKKRSGAPRERSGAPRERSAGSRERTGAPRERSGAPRDAEQSQTRTYRAARPDRDSGRTGSPRGGRSDSARGESRGGPRGPRSEGGGGASRGASRGPRREGSFGGPRSEGSFGGARGSSRGEGRGGPRGARDEGSAYGAPRGESRGGSRSPRGEGGFGGARGESRGGSRGPRSEGGFGGSRGESRGGPRGPRGEGGFGGSRGGPRGEGRGGLRGSRDEGGAYGAPRGESRGGSRGPRGEGGFGGSRGGPRGEGRGGRRGSRDEGGAYGAPRGESRGGSRGPRSEGRGGSRGAREDGGAYGAPRGESRGGPGREGSGGARGAGRGGSRGGRPQGRGPRRG